MQKFVSIFITEERNIQRNAGKDKLVAVYHSSRQWDVFAEFGMPKGISTNSHV